MTGFIRYTPHAVQLIRNGASAADLGWSGSMYDSVCLTHGIARPPRPQEIIHYRNPKAQIVEYRQRSSEIIRGDIILALPREHAEIFTALYKRWLAGDDRFASAAALHDSKVYRGDFDRRLRMNANRAVHRLSQLLAPLRIWIETKPRYGYRLRVDA